MANGFSLSAALGLSGSDKDDIKKKAISVSFCQWSVEPNDVFRPSGPRKPTLEAGVYNVGFDQMGVFFTKMKVVTDSLIQLDDSANDRVLVSMKQFWQSKEEYTKRSLVFKRGLLLFGPAGSGKTSTINLLTNTLIKMDGLVLMCGHPAATAGAISALRRIEPDRNIIVVYEDLDELIEKFSEHDLLSLLDGEDQTDNIVHLASTNFPDKLGARICNRPSRFDELIHVGMPNDKAREQYLRHVLKDEDITDETIPTWVADTENFSVAHLKELAVGVFCLKQPYDSVLGRLKKMQVAPKALPEFNKQGGFGFGEQLEEE